MGVKQGVNYCHTGRYMVVVGIHTWCMAWLRAIGFDDLCGAGRTRLNKTYLGVGVLKAKNHKVSSGVTPKEISCYRSAAWFLRNRLQ